MLEPSWKGESFQPTKTIEALIDLALRAVQNALIHLGKARIDPFD